MVRFLISAAGQNAMGGRCLLEGGAYSDLTVNGAALTRWRRLAEARCLLEEIQYPFLHTLWQYCMG